MHEYGLVEEPVRLLGHAPPVLFRHRNQLISRRRRYPHRKRRLAFRRRLSVSRRGLVGHCSSTIVEMISHVLVVTRSMRIVAAGSTRSARWCAFHVICQPGKWP